jgi:eukaryotic-like serine/threonine-protein kinase
LQVRFLTMQLIEGPTLKQWMGQPGGAPVSEKLALLKDVLEGLEAAHKAGIAHCDLKPSNILVQQAEGQQPRAVITDFGVAQLPPVSHAAVHAGHDRTQPSLVGGTPPYMAPEMRFECGDRRSGDIFAVGVVAYKLLTGLHPFGGQAPWDIGPDFRVVPPRSLDPEIPAAWDAAILQSLAVDPSKRFARVSDLRSALEIPEPSETASRKITRRALVYGGAASVAGVAGTLLLRRGAGPRAIAVLPFENASNEQSLDYLGDGITESLINSLSQLSSLRVPAAGLVRRFKGKDTPTQAGQELNASAVLAGRIRRAGGLLSVDAELIDTSSGRQIWGKQYNLTWSNALDVQESICAGILSGLQLQLGGHETNILRRGLTSDQEAFDFYLRGQYLMGLRTEESLAQARDYFTRAVERDPKFALAYCGGASARPCRRPGRPPQAEGLPHRKPQIPY